MWLHELADADASCGGKALGLARLIAAGLPVPPGFAIEDAAFQHIARLAGDADHSFAEAAGRIAHAELPDFERELRARAAMLGVRLIVRSSAAFEDGLAGSAAGVLESIRDVTRDDVWRAVRTVWLSALTPQAVAYARRHAAALRVGVIVQAFVPGALVTVYTRPPGAPAADEVLVQRGAHLARESRSSPSALGVLALRAETAIGAAAGADVELVGNTIVQARPVVHPSRRVRQPPPPIVIAPLLDGREWTWDVAHNPDPLSPAQAGLVERVASLGAYELRVCAGYLYTTPRTRFSALVADDVRTSAAAIIAKLDAALAKGEPAPTVAVALECYAACYAIWANELAPLVAAARARTSSLAHRPSSVEVTLARAARGELGLDAVLDRLGDLAPAWDVAVPSFREMPEIVRGAIARATRLDSDVTAPPVPDDSLAGFAADLAERDDVYFARMQQVVRRALLARSVELDLEGDDIFWLALDGRDLCPAGSTAKGRCGSIDTAEGRIDRDSAHRRASAARAANARASAWDMPLVVGGAPRSPGRALHGLGSGPRVTGRAVRFATLAGATLVSAGDVVVVRAVTPALAMFVGSCAAIVSETGGLLDHGAALARELGITCVVGCHDAWHELSDGMLVTVDGDAGTVYSSSS